MKFKMPLEDRVDIQKANNAAGYLWRMAHGPNGMLGLMHPDALHQIAMILDMTKNVLVKDAKRKQSKL
jgi:hypothetical protein